MQSSTAEKLRKEWGAAFCHHPMLDHEYEQATRTGNLVCLICGRTFSERQMLLAIYLPFLLAVCSAANSLEIIKLLLDYF